MDVLNWRLMKNSQEPLKRFTLKNNFSLSNQDFNATPYLMSIVEAKNSEIHYLNSYGSLYSCDDENIKASTENCFLKDFIHPEDQLNYLIHLNSCKDLGEGEEEISYFQMKNRKGGWSSFCFIDRLYMANPDSGQPQILSKIQLVPEKKDSNNTLQKRKPGIPIQPNQYRQLLSSIDEAFCLLEMIFDKEGKPFDIYIVSTNPAFEKHINLKNVKCKTIRELLPNSKEHVLEKFGEVAKSGKSVRFQEFSENLGNIWLDLNVFKVGNSKSRSIAVLFRNITQRKKAEARLLNAKSVWEVKSKQRKIDLEESKELLQTVFDTTNLAIAVLKTVYAEDGSIQDFRFAKVNKVLREMYLDRDVIGASYLETSQYGVKLGIFDAFKVVMATGETFEKEIYFNKDGYDNWFRIIAKSRKDLLITSIEDISKRKFEAQELIETVRFKEQLVRTSPDTIMIINLNTFSVRFINNDIFKEGGVTREKVQGMSFEKLIPFVHPRDREDVMNMHRKLLKSSEDDIIDIEVRLKLKGNTWDWFSVRGKIFHRKNENWVEEYVLLLRNITSQKSVQKALLKAEKLSIQGEIARTFAHELRNPLASISMATDILRKKLENHKNEGLDKYLDIHSRSTKTVNNLIYDLLNSSNYSPSVLKKEDLAKIIDLTLEKAADRIYLSGIKLEKKYNGPYPIMADKEKLCIALLNIIVNASEAVTPDEGLIEIEIKEHKTDFLLKITDNGHGMENEEIDKLFDAFYSKKAKGVGIGLSSVKNILEEHDAQVKVLSKPNKGTSFHIFFNNIQKE